MTLVEELEQEVKEAMLARDTQRRDALRLILSSLKSAEKELLRPLSEDEELQVLQRERKKRNEAAEAFRAARPHDQAAKEEGELAILEEFMPEPLSEDELDRDRRRRDRRERCDEHSGHGARDGGRDAADRGPRRRVGGEPARPREARVIAPLDLGLCRGYEYEGDPERTAIALPGAMLGGMPALWFAFEPLVADGWRVILVWDEFRDARRTSGRGRVHARRRLRTMRAAFGS